MRKDRNFGTIALLVFTVAGLTGCYQSMLKETPPVRFTQDHLGKPLENLLGERREGVGDESNLEAFPASLQTAAADSRSG